MPLIVPPAPGERFVDPPESRELAATELKAHRELAVHAGNIAILGGKLNELGQYVTPDFEPELDDFDGTNPEEIISYQLVWSRPLETVSVPHPGYTQLFVNMRPGYRGLSATARELEAGQRILWTTLGVPVEQPFESIGSDEQDNMGATVYWPHSHLVPRMYNPQEELPKALPSDSQHFKDAADTIAWVEGKAGLAMPVSLTQPVWHQPGLKT